MTFFGSTAIDQQYLMSRGWYEDLPAAVFFEQRSRVIDGEEVYLSPFNDPELKALGQDVRREIMAGKFGMTWAEISKLSGATLTAMILDAQGKTYSSGTEAGIKAAQKDARWVALESYLAGASGVGVVAVAGLVVAGIFVAYKKRQRA